MHRWRCSSLVVPSLCIIFSQVNDIAACHEETLLREEFLLFVFFSFFFFLSRIHRGSTTYHLHDIVITAKDAKKRR